MLDTEATQRFHSPAAEVSALLTEHFDTPVRSPYGRGTPTQLAFLLDHEYSRHGLTAGLLKGVDAERVAVLRAASDAAGFDCALALAEVQETWEPSRPTTATATSTTSTREDRKPTTTNSANVSTVPSP